MHSYESLAVLYYTVGCIHFVIEIVKHFKH
jgi:hypothetical protein